MSQKIKTSVEIDGSLTANSIVKSGGTASQILAADGSVVTAGSGVTISGGTISASGSAGVLSFNTRTGAVTLTSGDVTTALGYAPYNASNPAGYISSYTETDTLASVTARGSLTNTPITIAAGTLNHVTLGDRFNLIGGSNLHITNNAYYDSGFKYKFADLATKLALQADGILSYQTAVTGTVGSAVTFDTKFSVDSSGNLIVLGTLSASGYNKTNWDTAYGWGNHASAGYATSGHTHGLGRHNLAAPALIDSLTTSNFRSTFFGTSANDYQISTARFNSVPAPFSGLNMYGTAFAWSGADTHGFLAVDYIGAAAIIGGGNGQSINWTKRLAFLDDTVPNNRTITINGTTQDLSANRSFTVTANETDTLASVTGRGNTTTSQIGASNFFDVNVGSYNVNLGSGGLEGRGLVAGYSGGSYGGIGYNVRHTTTGGSWIAPLSDTSSYLLFNAGGFNFQGAGSGASGRTLSYTTLATLNLNGIFTVPGDVRSPIFYDSGNTSFYLDPGSASYSSFNAGGARFRNIDISNSTFTDTIQHVSSGGTIWINYGHNGPVGLGFGGGLTTAYNGLAVNGVSSATGDMRSPIFYDSNNTGFYLDPASTSVFNNLTLTGPTGNTPYLTLANGPYFSTISSGEIILRNLSSLRFTDVNDYDYNAWAGLKFVNSTKTIHIGVGGSQFTTNTTQTGFVNMPNCNLTVERDIRTPIFYDSNDTSYYLDPNSTSRLLAVNAPSGFTSVGNPWGTANSAYFPNGITTAGSDNWIYGHTYVGNAPANGAGHEFWSTGKEYHRSNEATNGHGASGRWLSIQSANGNFIPYSFESEYGNHSWGTVARFRINQSGADRPSIQFSNASNDTRWNIGYCYADDNFRIVQNMGYRNDNSTSDGWGTQRLLLDTAGNFYSDGLYQSNASLRSPIYYDSGNTGYYVDAASTTKLNALTLSSLASDDGMIENNTGGYFHLGGWGVGRTAATAVLVNTAYRSDYADNATNSDTVDGYHGDTFYRNLGFGSGYPSWNLSTVDPDRSGFTYSNGGPYTGPFIHIGASGYGLQFNAPYGGDGYGLAFRTRNGDTGNWNSWRYPAIYGVNANGGGELFATRYYDQNDTAYYCDPSDMTNIRNITVSSLSNSTGLTVNHSGSVSSPAAKFNSAGGGTTYGANTVTIDGCNYGSGLRIVTNLWGASQQAVQFTGPTTTVGTITCTTSSTSYNTSSDYRLKENVTPIESPINRLKELNPCRFNFINSPEKTVDGFIAHEVQEIIPEAITGEKDELDYDGSPKYQGIDQSKIVPLLTAALQEAILKIEELENRLSILENK